MRNQEPDTVKLEQAKATLAAKLDVYEQILAKQKYLAGDVSGTSLRLLLYRYLTFVRLQTTPDRSLLWPTFSTFPLAVFSPEQDVMPSRRGPMLRGGSMS